ncbi:MAG: SusD/RagB family nutrient-binding outer membrane lipoprotein [Rikenellaceae bacterium]
MKKNKYIFALLAGVMVSFSSCTDGFIEDNAINGAFNDEVKQYDNQMYTANFEIMQSGIYFNYAGIGLNWTWQLTQALHHDMYSGYFHDQVAAFNDKNSVYNVNTGWSNAAWNYTYSAIFPIAYQSELLCADTETALHFLGLTKIIKVELMHRIADTYGPIVYTKFGSGEDNDVDTLEEAYSAFFEDLDAGIEAIEEYLSLGYSDSAFAPYDMLNGGTLTGWLKFANSLRLRLAMRVSNVDPVLAKSEAQKALTNSNGLLESSSETIQVSGSSYSNPLYAVGVAWGEAFMGATMASLLNGYEDPRREVWYNKATLVGSEDTWLGVPQGVLMSSGDPNHYGVYSALNGNTITATTPAVLMTAAEVWFLRAEAALRGYSSENVQACYETGVETSFAQWGVSGAADYLACNKTPLDYTEMVAASGGVDMPALISISPSWDSSADNEGKLEQIITQKWIACWPESYEAWSEQRRTGYPRLFKVQYNGSNGAIDTEEMIRRLPFSTDDASSDPVQYDYLVKALGDTDDGGSRLWWDVGENRF